VTYPRQDFSILSWEDDRDDHRFDFLVRARRLTAREAHDLRVRLAVAGPSPYERAAAEALRKLTGRDLGTDAAAWRRYLAKRKR
jgi:hypothetical protein